MMKILRMLFVLGLLFANKANADEYYVNSASGDDSNNGTSKNTPWKSLVPVQNKAFQPGDIVNFARGSTWTKAAWEYVLLIDNDGTTDKPITFRAYGSGSKPSFSNGGNKWNKGIKVSASHVIIEDLLVTNTGHAAFEFTHTAENNVVKNCEVSKCGIGFHVFGKHNKFTHNYIHDLIMIVNNELPDTDPGGGDFGCVSFWLYAPNNEIAYNQSVNNIGHSYDYKFDGGFVELYENCDHTYIHHNWVENGVGIVEASLGTGRNIKIAYNVFIENFGLFALHTNHFEIENFRFENNTCITKKGTIWNNMFNWWSGDLQPGTMIVQNNIFVLGGDADERIIKGANDFIHQNNIYYLLDGAQLGSLELGPGELVANPKFVNEENNNFKLLEGSPAIDKGIKLDYDIDFLDRVVPFGTFPDIGAYEFDFTTEVKSIDAETNWVTLFPTPINSELNVKYNWFQDQEMEIIIMNLQGKKIRSYVLSEPCGSNQSSIKIGAISSGTYLFKISVDNRSVTKLISVVR